MVKQIKKNKSRSWQKQLAVVIALVNGFNNAAPIALPLATIDVTAPVARRGEIERELANSFNRGGQLLDRLFFSTAYAEVINDGVTKNVELENSPADGDIINKGGTQNVNASGSATNTVVNGGIQNVNNGGSATSTTINSGHQLVSSGGSATGTIINGGFQNVNGGTVSGTIISSGIQNVHSGTAKDTTISGGTQFVYRSAEDTLIHSGGNQTVRFHNGSGGIATNTTIQSGGIQQVSSGATATNTIISAGGQQNVYLGGTANNLNVYGTQTVYGTTSGSMIMDGGKQTVHSGGTATNGSIQSGGTQTVSSGATAVSATINNEGWQYVYNGGSAAGTTIHGGGTQELSGSATGTTISGGKQDVSGGSAISTIIHAGGEQNVRLGGKAIHTTISGGRQDINIGGTATSSTINNFGDQKVYGGGTATDTTINDGQQEVFSGGTATDTTINSGGQQIVSTGGIANNTTINGFIDSAGDIYSYGLQELYGTASATTINSGGQQVVNGGSASSSMINSGGEQIVYNSGTATGTTINGGEQNVNAGGSTTGTTINGGEQNVNADGSTTGTTINSGGKQNVYNSGSATNTTVHNGGWQTVRSGAIVTDTTINGGSVILINDGATLAGSTILNQGSIQAGLDNDLSYTIEDLTVTGGKIILSNVTPESINKTADRRLTIDKLTGAANFIIATDLAKGKADHITIASGGSVQHTLQIAYDPLYESDDTIDGVSVPFAAVPGSGIGFSAVATDYGAYRYTPTLAASPDGTVWSITGLDLSDSGLPEPSETCYTASDAATGSLMIWRQENNSLIRRMGELRNNPGESGDWVRVYKGEQEIANIGTRSTTQRYTAIQGGHDSKVDFWGRTWRAGYVVGYLDSDLSLAHGSGDATSLSIGGYAAWLGESGHFLDLIIKQGRLKTSYDSYLNDPDNTKVSGSYRNWGTSFSAEYGWRKQLAGNWYLEPQAELTLGRIGSDSYTASDGTTVRHNSLNSVIGRLGLAAGRTTDSGNFYAKASLVREFNANSRVTMASGGHAPVTLEQNLKENWLELAVGVTGALSEKTDGYLEVSRTTGDKVKTPWQVNLGTRWNF